MTATHTTAVRCPACNGGRYLPRSRDFVAGDRIEPCSLCRNSGTLDPDEWYASDDPARLVAMLGGTDNERLGVWTKALDQLWEERMRRPAGSAGHDSVDEWLLYLEIDGAVERVDGCDLLRCVFPNPLIERERCPECGGKMVFDGSEGNREEPPIPYGWVCTECGIEAEPSPRIDPRWFTTDVLGLLATVRGGQPICANCKQPADIDNPNEVYCCDDCGFVGSDITDPDLSPFTMNILADALGEAGMDSYQIERHLRTGPHISGCWVVQELQAAIMAAGG